MTNKCKAEQQWEWKGERKSEIMSDQIKMGKKQKAKVRYGEEKMSINIRRERVRNRVQ